jgi:hypothetical protein
MQQVLPLIGYFENVHSSSCMKIKASLCVVQATVGVQAGLAG